MACTRRFLTIAGVFALAGFLYFIQVPLGARNVTSGPETGRELTRRPMSRAELRAQKPTKLDLYHRIIHINGKKGLTRPIVGKPVRYGVSKPLREIKPPRRSVQGPMIVVREVPNERMPWEDLPATRSTRPTEGVQTAFPSMMTPTESFSYKAITNEDNANVFGFVIMPPDVEGDVGPGHFLQYNNLVLSIYDKSSSGTPLLGPIPLSSIYISAGFTGPCASNDDGDPVVLYDQYADQWIVTQFQLTVGPPFSMCIAISQTGDPTGSYFLYEFVMPNDKMNDYPKFGIKPEAYYMTDNQFDVTGSTPNCVFGWCGAGVFAYDRKKMLQGDPTASYIYFDLFLLDPGIGGMLPLDFDGLTPPAGVMPDGLFAYFTADEFGDPQDGLRLFDFHPDWTTPANSTFTERTESPITVSDFNPLNPPGRSEIDQPGTTVGLNAISDRLMHRLVGRVLGSNTNMVVAHTVCVNSIPDECNDQATYHAGVRWYHLRMDNTTGTISLNDQGTIAPDGDDRWMPSMAINNAGDICVIYTVSSSSTFPSVRYTCRQPGDPAGQMQTEQPFSAGVGTGSQTGGNRWGDYSMLTVDPVDECTFWGTHEYYLDETTDPPPCFFSASLPGWCWQTMVGTFPAPSSGTCSAPQTGTLQGNVSSSEVAIQNAFVDVDGIFSRLTDGSGNYSMNIPPGTYDVTVSATGCTPKTVQVTVTAGNTTVQDFTLSCQPVLEVDSFSWSGGDGDTFPDFNECASFSVTLKNKGWVTATNVSGTLSTSTSGVGVTVDTVNYGNIGPQAMVSPVSPFNVQLSPSFGCTPVDLAFSAISNEGATASANFTIDPEVDPAPTASFQNNTQVVIPDDGSGPATSTIDVSGFTDYLGKVTATIHITHTWDGDLVIDLQNPAGTTVTLSQNNGGSGDNYGTDCPADSNDTTFDDDATTPISAGSAPFVGSFIPDNPLSVFAGTNPIGAWSLVVTDTFAFADSGNLECWTLNLYKTSCNDGGGVCVSVILNPSSLDVDDSGGNNNGVWDPGETVGPLPGWENIGDTTSSTTSVITSTDPDVTIIDGDGAYAVPGGSVADCSSGSDCYSASVSATRPVMHWDVNIDEELDDTVAGIIDKTWTFHIGGSFGDVSMSNIFYKDIETIFHHGVTLGCGSGNYCPKQTVPRKQMAAFIARAIYGDDASIPTSGTVGSNAYDCVNGPSLFTDVPVGSTFCKHIHAIASLGITLGCSATEYCPDQPIRRDQMAAFLARALVGNDSGIPLTGMVGSSAYDCVNGPSLFNDVPVGSTFCKHIHYIYSQNITSGCGGGNYCPLNSTTREQMAKFLVRTFNLLLYAP